MAIGATAVRWRSIETRQVGKRKGKRQSSEESLVFVHNPCHATTCEKGGRARLGVKVKNIPSSGRNDASRSASRKHTPEI